MRTIPWVTLLCEMGTARPLRRWTATKHGRYNERFYHKEPVMPTKAGTCSMGTPGRVEHRARNASGQECQTPLKNLEFGPGLTELGTVRS